jgi:hypothetical protein
MPLRNPPRSYRLLLTRSLLDHRCPCHNESPVCNTAMEPNEPTSAI